MRRPDNSKLRVSFFLWFRSAEFGFAELRFAPVPHFVRQSFVFYLGSSSPLTNRVPSTEHREPNTDYRIPNTEYQVPSTSFFGLWSFIFCLCLCLLCPSPYLSVNTAYQGAIPLFFRNCADKMHGI